MSAPDAATEREPVPLSDRLAIWRMRWFPYRTYEYLGRGNGYGPAKWQWPDVLGRRHRV